MNIPDPIDKRLRQRAQEALEQSKHRRDAGGGIAEKITGERGEWVLERQLKQDQLHLDRETAILPGDKTGSADYKTDFTVYVDGKPYRVDCKTNERSAMKRRGDKFILNATVGKDCALYIIVLVENKRDGRPARGEVLGAVKCWVR